MNNPKTRSKTSAESTDRNSRKSGVSNRNLDGKMSVRLNKAAVLRAAANQGKVASESGITEKRRSARISAKSALKKSADDLFAASKSIGGNISPKLEARVRTPSFADFSVQGPANEILEDRALKTAESGISTTSERVEHKATSAAAGGPPSRPRSPTASIRTEESVSSGRWDQVIESLKNEVMVLVRNDLEQEKEDTTLAMHLASHAANDVTSLRKTIARLNEDLNNIVIEKPAKLKADTDTLISLIQGSVERMASEKLKNRYRLN